MIRSLFPWFFLSLALLPGNLFGQVEILGRIIDQARTGRGDFPPRQLLIELRLHGGVVESVYTDNEGRFGFSNLHANGYRVVVNDDDYYPVEERADVNPDVMPYTRVLITLRPREEKQNDDLGARASGGNRYLIDPSDYNKRFPKKALKEYKQGLEAERVKKHDEAIAHYLTALQIAPDYYPS